MLFVLLSETLHSSLPISQQLSKLYHYLSNCSNLKSLKLLIVLSNQLMIEIAGYSNCINISLEFNLLCWFLTLKVSLQHCYTLVSVTTHWTMLS